MVVKKDQKAHNVLSAGSWGDMYYPTWPLWAPCKQSKGRLPLEYAWNRAFVNTFLRVFGTFLLEVQACRPKKILEILEMACVWDLLALLLLNIVHIFWHQIYQTHSYLQRRMLYDKTRRIKKYVLERSLLCSIEVLNRIVKHKHILMNIGLCLVPKCLRRSVQRLRDGSHTQC